MARISLIQSFAMRDTAKSKGLLFLIIISMSVAFTSMVVTASILKGFNNMLIDGEVGWLGQLVIKPLKGELAIKNIDKVKNELNKINEIKSYSARSYGTFTLKYKDVYYQPYTTVGFNVLNEENTSLLKNKLIEGNFLDSLKPDEVVIGKMLAQSFEGNPYSKNGKLIDIGEKIEVISQTGKINTYKIRGIIDGKTFIPNWLLIFNKDELEKLDDSQKNSEVIILLKDEENMEKVKDILKNKNLGVNVYTWREQAGYADDIIAGISFITMLINNLIVVSVFVVVSIIIFINILQKRRQIGILKSMGTSNKFVISVYVFETLIYVFWSCLIGTMLFWAINFFSNAYPISMLIGDFHTVFDFQIILNSALTMLVAAIGGTLAPAIMATKIKIVDVIRDNV